MGEKNEHRCRGGKSDDICDQEIAQKNGGEGITSDKISWKEKVMIKSLRTTLMAVCSQRSRLLRRLLLHCSREREIRFTLRDVTTGDFESTIARG